MKCSLSLADLPDPDLLAEVKRLAVNECQATASLVSALAEVDTRKAYLGEGYSSLFTYCTQGLHLSEHAAYRRIEAARATRKFPLILDRLAGSEINLTAISLLAPHLTSENHRDLLDAARRKTRREVEALVARICPRPDTQAVVRKLPERKGISTPATSNGSGDTQAAGGIGARDTAVRTPSFDLATMSRDDGVSAASGLPTVRSGVSVSTAAYAADADRACACGAGTSACGVLSPSQRRTASVGPIAPGRFKLQVTIDGGTHGKLLRARDLLRHTVPDGDLAAILDKALTLLVAHLEKTKTAATNRPRIHGATTPRRRTRYIPATVRREVWVRDRGQCAFVGRTGVKCEERGFLEFHHRVPYAAGGEASAANLELRCRSHNMHEAIHYFGSDMAERPGSLCVRTGDLT